MRRIFFVLGAVLLLAATSVAAEKGYLDKLPPIIDREVIFGDPEIAGGQISNDGKYISFRKPYNDIMNIWVKRIDQPFDEAWPVTADTTRAGVSRRARARP